jgi:hypothetical protein
MPQARRLDVTLPTAGHSQVAKTFRKPRERP